MPSPSGRQAGCNRKINGAETAHTNTLERIVVEKLPPGESGALVPRQASLVTDVYPVARDRSDLPVHDPRELQLIDTEYRCDSGGIAQLRGTRPS